MYHVLVHESVRRGQADEARGRRAHPDLKVMGLETIETLCRHVDHRQRKGQVVELERLNCCFDR